MAERENKAETHNIKKLEGWISFPEAAKIIGITKQGFHKIVFDNFGTFETIRAIGEKPMYVVSTAEVLSYKRMRDDLIAMRKQMKQEREDRTNDEK